MIETRGLRKSFGDHVVLDGVDLDVASGTIFARKSTGSALALQHSRFYQAIHG